MREFLDEKIEFNTNVLYRRLGESHVFYPVRELAGGTSTTDIMTCRQQCLANYFPRCVADETLHSEECAKARCKIMQEVILVVDPDWDELTWPLSYAEKYLFFDSARERAMERRRAVQRAHFRRE